MKLYVWEVNTAFDQSVLIAMAESEEMAVVLLIEDVVAEGGRPEDVHEAIELIKPTVYHDPKGMAIWRRR